MFQHVARSALDSLERATHAGTWVLRLGASPSLWWSSGTRRLVEWTAEDGDPDLEAAMRFYLPDSRARIVAAIEHAAATGDPFDLDLEIQVRSGRLFVRVTCIAQLVGGRVAQLAGTIQNVDRRRRAEDRAAAMGARLVEFEERWRLATEGSGLGVWDWNAQTGEVFYSEQWKKMLGFEAQQISTHRSEWDGRLHPDDREACCASLRAHLDGETAFYVHEHRVRCADGQYRWILDRGRVTARSADGQPLRVVGTHTDIDERKRLEAAAAEHAARYEAIFNSTFQFIGLVSPDGTTVTANQTALRFAGVEHADVVGKPFWETPWWPRDPEVRQRVRDAVERVARGEAVHYEAEVLGRDQRTTIIDFSLRPVFDAAGRVALLVPEGHDITAQVHAQHALDQRERLFRATFDHAPIGTAIVSLDGRFLEVNNALCAILGASAEQLKERTFADITHPDDLEEDLSHLRLLVAGHTHHYVMEKRYLRPDGGMVTAQLDVTAVRDADGRPTCFLSQVQDITERQRTRRDLEREKELAQVTLASIGDGVVRTDADGRITFVNASALALLGRTGETFVGQAFDDLIGPMRDDAGQVLESPVVRVLHHPDAIGGQQASIRPAPGVLLPIEASCSPVRSGDGTVVGAVFVFRDITAMRERERALREARREAESATRAKSQFLANMSHEIRTPMNAVLGMLQILRRTAIDAQQADFLDQAEGAATSLLQILDDILDLSKIEAGKLVLDPHPFVLHQLVEEVLGLCALQIGSRPIALDVRIDPGIPDALEGDSLRIRQVLLNLVGNAVKFTERGGIRLDLRLAGYRGDRVVIAVAIRDTGIGMTAEQIGRVFDSFEQAESSTTRQFGGTGLGLPLSRRLVRMMGGDLRVDSELHRGSCFQFDLILRTAMSPPPVAPEGKVTVPPRDRLTGLRILVVEDNATNQVVARELLRREGAIVTLVADGRAGVNAVRDAVPPYDLVLMDIQMPVMDGYEAAVAIRAEPRFAALPIIAMTANAMPADVAASLAVGMNAHLGKPFKIDDLVARIRQVVPGAPRPTPAASCPSAGRIGNEDQGASAEPVDLVGRFEKTLRSNDLAAIEVYRSLRAVPGALTQSMCARLDRAMHALDFTAALRACSELARSAA